MIGLTQLESHATVSDAKFRERWFHLWQHTRTCKCWFFSIQFDRAATIWEPDCLFCCFKLYWCGLWSPFWVGVPHLFLKGTGCVSVWYWKATCAHSHLVACPSDFCCVLCRAVVVMVRVILGFQTANINTRAHKWSICSRETLRYCQKAQVAFRSDMKRHQSVCSREALIHYLGSPV